MKSREAPVGVGGRKKRRKVCCQHRHDVVAANPALPVPALAEKALVETWPRGSWRCTHP